MILFLCLLFPLGFSIWSRAQGKENLPKLWTIAFAGVFPAAVFCAYKFFFSPFYYLPQDSFFLNFLYLFLTQIFVPILVLLFAFMAIDKKDSAAERFENIFPFFAGFYAVFLPFRIITDVLPMTFFLFFVKPIFYFFMLLSLSKVFSVFFGYGRPRPGDAFKKTIFFYAALFVLLAPAVIESLWFMGLTEFLIAAFSVAYIAVCVAILAVNK